jgi:NTP pyrophosphatase (non-canonical NTP hydrolase)
MQHFNSLTPAEAERLALIAEEAAEVIHAITKIQRHGFESCHPTGGPDNRHMLEIELGDLHTAVRMAVDAGDLDALKIDAAAKLKAKNVGRYLHHQSA